MLISVSQRAEEDSSADPVSVVMQAMRSSGWSAILTLSDDKV
jgi:hypothetical protein